MDKFLLNLTLKMKLWTFNKTA